LAKLIINDQRKGKSKGFEEMTHNHDLPPTRLQEIACQRCHYDKAENSIPKNQFTIKDENGNNITITEIKIIRGRFDDCIGWSYQ